MRRHPLIVGALTCACLIGLVASLKSRRVAESLKAYVQRAVHAHHGLSLSIDDLRLQLFPPGVALRGVTLSRPTDTEPWVVLHRGEATIRPLPSVDGLLVIERFELDGLKTRVEISPEAIAAASADPDGRRLPVDVRRLRLHNASVVVRFGDRELEVRRADLVVEPGTRARRDVTADVEVGTLRFEGGTTDFEAHARGSLRGTLNAPKQVTIARARAFAKGLAITASGEIGLDERAELDLKGSGTVSLEQARRLLPDDVAELSGQARFRAELRGTVEEPNARINLHVEDLAFAGETYRSVKMDAEVNSGRVLVEAFRVEHRLAGAVTGSGAVTLNDGLDLELSARLHRVSLPDVLHLTGLGDAWVRMWANGDVSGHGSLKPFFLGLDVDLLAQSFASLTGSYRSAGSETVLYLAETTLRGRLHVGDRAVQIDSVRLGSGSSSVLISGSLAYDPVVGMDLRAAGDHVDLLDLGPITGVDFRGQGPVAATVEGPYADPTVSATVEADALAVLDYDIGDSKATLFYHDTVLELGRATVRRPKGTATGHGRLVFAETAIAVQADFQLADVPLGGVLHTLGLSPQTARRFEASTSGSVLVGGELLAPVGVVNAHAPDLRIDAVQVGPMRLACGFGDPGQPFWIEGHVEHEEGTVDGRVAWASAEQGNTIDITARAARMPLAHLAPFMGDIPIEGALEARARLRGPPSALSGSITASAHDLVTFGVRLEKAELQGRARDGQLNIHGTVLSGDADVAAQLGLNDRLTHSLTATFDGLEVDRLWALPRPLGAAVSGTFSSAGDLTDADSLTARAQLPNGEARWEKLVLRPVRPIVVTYARLRYDLGDIRLAGGGVLVTVSGELPLDAPLRLQVQAAGDLGIATLLLPDVSFARGKLDANLLCGGSWSAPGCRGTLRIQDGVVRLLQTDDLLDSLELNATIAGRTLVVQSGSATFGGGQMRLGGGATLPLDDATPELNLRADLTRVRLRPAADAEMTVSGDLSLVGRLDDMLLKGRLRLDEVRYTANLELERLIPRRHAAPLGVPSRATELAPALYVRVQAPNNIILSNNVLEAELRADVVVTGTTERPGLIGSVTSLWARARYRDNVFEVERASVDFVDEYRLHSQFQVQAHTEACGMRIGVNIAGDSDRYSVVVSGQDENGDVGPSGALACLQFGLRLQDFRERNATGLAETQWGGLNTLIRDTGWGGLDALWTVSGLDEKVRRLLPIDVDEFRLSSGWSPLAKRTTPWLLVGKEIGERVQLKYSRSLEELASTESSSGGVADQTLSLEYRLSDEATLQGSWASARDVPVGDFGLDLRLHWEFR